MAIAPTAALALMMANASATEAFPPKHGDNCGDPYQAVWNNGSRSGVLRYATFSHECDPTTGQTTVRWSIPDGWRICKERIYLYGRGQDERTGGDETSGVYTEAIEAREQSGLGVYQVHLWFSRPLKTEAEKNTPQTVYQCEKKYKPRTKKRVDCIKRIEAREG